MDESKLIPRCTRVLKALFCALYCWFCTQRHLHASSKSTLFVTKCSQTTHNSITLNRQKKYSDLVRSLQDCAKVIGLWMEENKLKLNNDKTEAIRFSLSSSINTTLSHPQTISLSNTDVEFSGTVRNLGFIFDSDLSVKQHIIKTYKAHTLKSDA